MDYVYSKGGPWDKFAGDDGHMTLDEAKAFAAEFRKQMKKHENIDMPDSSEAEWARAYKLYSGLSDGEGFTKDDAKKADRAIEWIRRKVVNWHPTKEQNDAFRPIWQNELKRIENLDDDSKQYKFA